MRSAALAALCAALAVTTPARAQQFTGTEVSAGAITAVSAHDFWGAAAGLGHRVDNQTRVAGLVAAGVLDNKAALRVEATAQLIVNPSGRGGACLYAGAGVSWQGATGMSGGGYVTALLGLESAPGSHRAWYAEAGLGGGVRLALGLRWRRVPPWWR